MASLLTHTRALHNVSPLYTLYYEYIAHYVLAWYHRLLVLELLRVYIQIQPLYILARAS